MSAEANKELIRRYIQALDDNDSSDWSVIDHYVAEDVIVHNPPLPGCTPDRYGIKQAAEMFRQAPPAGTRSGCRSPKTTLSSATSSAPASMPANCSASRRPATRSRPKAWPCIGSETARSSSIGRSPTSRACCNRWARCRGRRDRETSGPGLDSYRGGLSKLRGRKSRGGSLL